jgi:hypothetical protein
MTPPCVSGAPSPVVSGYQAITQSQSGDSHLVGGSLIWPLRGLSRVVGNRHARFLGELGAVMPSAYPAKMVVGWWTVLVWEEVWRLFLM